MKIEKQVVRTLILLIVIISLYNINSYCTVSGTKRMEITGGDPWVNINVSKAYEECDSLNSTTSTLGTNNLRAHLTTDADWSAMAIFSISQYGAATNNTPETTTGNVSGVYNPGKIDTFSTGILDTATKSTISNISGLFKDDGSLKPYMKQWSLTRTDNDFVGFKDLTNNGTYGWFNSEKTWSTYNDRPISAKIGLFGVRIRYGWGHTAGYFAAPAGASGSNVTFRPVIWN